MRGLGFTEGPLPQHFPLPLPPCRNASLLSENLFKPLSKPLSLIPMSGFVLLHYFSSL